MARNPGNLPRRHARGTGVGWFFLLCCFAALRPALAGDAGRPLAAVIIDDLGYSQYWGERTINLQGPVTCAILPHSPHSKELARLAHAEGKEVMLHAPMANTRGRPLGPGALTEDMSELSLLSRLLWNLSAVPYARGINNHMGSLLTQQEQPMRWVMRELKRHNVYFIDSRTTRESVVPDIALDHEVPFAVRDIFLDHERDPDKIASAFARFLRIAQARGLAVAIGHPYPETVRYLEKNLFRLGQAGIELVPASRVAAVHFRNQLAARSTVDARQARAAQPAALSTD